MVAVKKPIGFGMHVEAQGLQPEQASEGQEEGRGLGKANLGPVSEEGTV